MRPLLDPLCDPRIFKYFSISLVTNSILAMFAIFCYIQENIHHLTRITEPTFVVIAYLFALIKWRLLIQHKARINDLLEALDRILEKSE